MKSFLWIFFTFLLAESFLFYTLGLSCDHLDLFSSMQGQECFHSSYTISIYLFVLFIWNPMWIWFFFLHYFVDRLKNKVLWVPILPPFAKFLGNMLKYGLKTYLFLFMILGFSLSLVWIIGKATFFLPDLYRIGLWDTGLWQIFLACIIGFCLFYFVQNISFVPWFSFQGKAYQESLFFSKDILLWMKHRFPFLFFVYRSIQIFYGVLIFLILCYIDYWLYIHFLRVLVLLGFGVLTCLIRCIEFWVLQHAGVEIDKFLLSGSQDLVSEEE